MSYTFSLSRRSLPVRCLCLLLIVLVLWCFFMVPRAGAVALEATTIAYGGLLVGTILVGAGVVFSSHGDMVKVGNAMYKTLVNGSSAIGKTISSISAWAVEHGTSLAKGALRVGKDTFQAIVDSFKADYLNGVYSTGSRAFGTFISSRGKSDFYLRTWYWHSQYSGFDKSEQLVFHFYFKCANDHHVGARYDGYYLSGVLEDTHSIGTTYSSSFALQDWFWSFDPSSRTVQFKTKYLNAAGEPCIDTQTVFTLPDDYLTSSVLSVEAFKPVSVTVPDSDLVYPSDDYLVKMPDIPSVDASTGDVTYPNDTAYTKDAVAVPYPVDTEGVKVPDIPFDKPVDKSTGKTMDGTDTGTDTDNPSKPGEGADTGSNTGLLQKILDLLKNFFDSPSDFRLNMDGFRNLAIKDKFPFCIPFDMVDSVKQFAADAADYQFRVKLDTQYFKVDHVVDLTPLAVPLAFFRYLVVAWFAWVLMSRTHDLMKW